MKKTSGKPNLQRIIQPKDDRIVAHETKDHHINACCSPTVQNTDLKDPGCQKTVSKKNPDVASQKTGRPESKSDKNHLLKKIVKRISIQEDNLPYKAEDHNHQENKKTEISESGLCNRYSEKNIAKKDQNKCKKNKNGKNHIEFTKNNTKPKNTGAITDKCVRSTDFHKKRPLEIDKTWIDQNYKHFISTNIIAITGAGISTPDIPDFRSEDGLFVKIKRKYGISGKDCFDYKYSIDSETRSNYLKIMSELSQLIRKAKPNIIHHFLTSLKKVNRSFRLYDQNIDGLSEQAGLSSIDLNTQFRYTKGDIVYLHGKLNTLICTFCGYKTCLNKNIEAMWEQGHDVECPQCISHVEAYQDKPSSLEIYFTPEDMGLNENIKNNGFDNQKTTIDGLKKEENEKKSLPSGCNKNTGHLPYEEEPEKNNKFDEPKDKSGFMTKQYTHSPMKSKTDSKHLQKPSQTGRFRHQQHNSQRDEDRQENIEEQLPIEKPRRSRRHLSTIGILNTQIIHYNQEHPFSSEISQIFNRDLKKMKTFIVMGTSLRIPGVRDMLRAVSNKIRHLGGISILINNEIREAQHFDYIWKGEIAEFVRHLDSKIISMGKLRHTAKSRSELVHNRLKTQHPKCDLLKFFGTTLKKTDSINIESDGTQEDKKGSGHKKTKSANIEMDGTQEDKKGPGHKKTKSANIEMDGTQEEKKGPGHKKTKSANIEMDGTQEDKKGSGHKKTKSANIETDGTQEDKKGFGQKNTQTPGVNESLTTKSIIFDDTLKRKIDIKEDQEVTKMQDPEKRKKDTTSEPEYNQDVSKKYNEHDNPQTAASLNFKKYSPTKSTQSIKRNSLLETLIVKKQSFSSLLDCKKVLEKINPWEMIEKKKQNNLPEKNTNKIHKITEWLIDPVDIKNVPDKITGKITTSDIKDGIKIDTNKNIKEDVQCVNKDIATGVLTTQNITNKDTGDDLASKTMTNKDNGDDHNITKNDITNKATKNSDITTGNRKNKNITNKNQNILIHEDIISEKQPILAPKYVTSEKQNDFTLKNSKNKNITDKSFENGSDNKMTTDKVSMPPNNATNMSHNSNNSSFIDKNEARRLFIERRISELARPKRISDLALKRLEKRNSMVKHGINDQIIKNERDIKINDATGHNGMNILKRLSMLKDVSKTCQIPDDIATSGEVQEESRSTSNKQNVVKKETSQKNIKNTKNKQVASIGNEKSVSQSRKEAMNIIETNSSKEQSIAPTKIHTIKHDRSKQHATPTTQNKQPQKPRTRDKNRWEDSIQKKLGQNKEQIGNTGPTQNKEQIGNIGTAQNEEQIQNQEPHQKGEFIQNQEPIQSNESIRNTEQAQIKGLVQNTLAIQNKKQVQNKEELVQSTKPVQDQKQAKNKDHIQITEQAISQEQAKNTEISKIETIKPQPTKGTQEVKPQRQRKKPMQDGFIENIEPAGIDRVRPHRYSDQTVGVRKFHKATIRIVKKSAFTINNSEDTQSNQSCEQNQEPFYFDDVFSDQGLNKEPINRSMVYQKKPSVPPLTCNIQDIFDDSVFGLPQDKTNQKCEILLKQRRIGKVTKDGLRLTPKRKIKKMKKLNK